MNINTQTAVKNVSDILSGSAKRRAGELSAAIAEQKAAQEAESSAQESGGGSTLAQLVKNNISSAADTSAMKKELSSGYDEAGKELASAIDASTASAVSEAEESKAQADSEYQSQRNAVAADEAQALDNSALYAELRGDSGGIGSAQYNSIQNTAAQNRAEIARAQTQLATDTAQKISELQSEGEYEKAEKLLDIAQEKLGQVTELEKWSAEYSADSTELASKLAEWYAGYELSANEAAESTTQSQTKQLAALGEAMLEKGLIPNSEQLAAMGMTESQAQQYITAQALEKQAEEEKNKKSDNVVGTDEWYAELYEKYGEDAALMLQYSYGDLGVSTKSASESLLAGYQQWYYRNM